MRSKSSVGYVQLVIGSCFVAVSLMFFSYMESQAFFLEWIGTFLVFTGLAYLKGRRMTLPLSIVVLVGGSLGDVLFLANLSPLKWILFNYMVFIHSLAGSFLGDAIRK
ncbi:MAG: hypothetical protein QXK39_05815 [Nitrososphaerota archaeon]